MSGTHRNLVKVSIPCYPPATHTRISITTILKPPGNCKQHGSM